MNAMTEFYSINILWCPEQTAMKWTVDALFSKGLILRDTSLPVVLQTFVGTVCIPTCISYSYIEHLYTPELCYCIADHMCLTSLCCELFMLHDNLHHLMSFDALSSVLSYSYVTQ